MSDKTKALPYLIQGSSIVVIVDNKSHTIDKNSHLSYHKIVDAIKEEDWETVRELIEPAVAICNYGQGNIKIVDNVIYWNDQVFHNALATRMIKMFQEGFSIDPMLKFMNNLMANPSFRSIDQLYNFLDKNSLPITEDGHFLAFKKVKKNYTDIHSGKFDNSVGQHVTMERNQVNDDPNQTCSNGLHFCSQSYLGSFGVSDDPVMILKINPKDVVSIPADYNGAKGRCCEYTVVGQVGISAEDEFDSVVNSDYDLSDEDDEYEDEYVDEDGDEPVLRPIDAWPFPTTRPDEPKDEPKDKPVAKAPAKVNKPKVQKYNVVRARQSWLVEYYDVTKLVGENMIAKNKRQKKAQLMLVPV